jgi:hypothetical protein
MPQALWMAVDNPGYHLTACARGHFGPLGATGGTCVVEESCGKPFPENSSPEVSCPSGLVQVHRWPVVADSGAQQVASLAAGD